MLNFSTGLRKWPSLDLLSAKHRNNNSNNNKWQSPNPLCPQPHLQCEDKEKTLSSLAWMNNNVWPCKWQEHRCPQIGHRCYLEVPRVTRDSGVCLSPDCGGTAEVSLLWASTYTLRGSRESWRWSHEALPKEAQVWWCPPNGQPCPGSWVFLSRPLSMPFQFMGGHVDSELRIFSLTGKYQDIYATCTIQCNTPSTLLKMGCSIL